MPHLTIKIEHAGVTMQIKFNSEYCGPSFIAVLVTIEGYQRNKKPALPSLLALVKSPKDNASHKKDNR
jgi:hypothetical protein